MQIQIEAVGDWENVKTERFGEEALAVAKSGGASGSRKFG
jgi:hypothetical protein